MRSWAQPTADEIRRLQSLAARPENRAYFFDRLDNPMWVGPLADAGFFSDPPGPVPAGEPGYIQFPPWPEGRYLVRAAPAAGDEVAAVLKRTERSDNPTVTRHLLESIAALPEASLRGASQRIVEWLQAPFADHFADEGAAAVVRLLEIGDLDRGLDAAASLLAVQPDPRVAQRNSGPDVPIGLHPEATSRLSDWQYERVVDQLRDAVVDRAGLRGVELYSTLLDDALRLSRWDDEDSDGLSVIWRPAVENHAQNSESGVRNTLVSATRDVAVRVAARSEADLVNVLDTLEGRSVIHRRIALHVLAVVDGGAGLVDARVGDRQLFDDSSMKHEYTTLLRNRFGSASAATRDAFLSWVSDGPDVADYRRRREMFDGEAPSDDEVERYVRTWRRDWLSFVAEHLVNGDAELYRALVTELGEPDHPDFLSWSWSWSGPESPFTTSELQLRAVQDVVTSLREWSPPDRTGLHFGPSVEGLGRSLSEDVQKRAAEYASIASSLADLDPTYVRNIFVGLERALRDGELFDWAEPLALAASAVSHPFESDAETADRNRDPGWRWCRREVASLLRTGFGQHPNRIHSTYREQVWRLIERLSLDPNPSVEHEQRYGGSNMDPLTLSLNTNRGAAMHAVVEYALWVRRELEAADQDVSVGFRAMPEVRKVLDAHLDPTVDPSLAVRAVYGRWLPWLLLLDEKWVLDRLDVLFPSAEDLAELRDAVWATYISWCPPYDSAYRALARQYHAALERVPTKTSSRNSRSENIDTKLGEHLVTFYWRDVVGATILDEFFTRASDELASDIMEFVGRALQNTVDDVPAVVRERIQQLWDRRIAKGVEAPDVHSAELRAFALSFASAKLDPYWALASLETTVALAGVSRYANGVVEKLVVLADSDPAAATRVLSAMLDHAENAWDHIGWRDAARSLVRIASRSDDPAVRERCAEIVDYYVQRGDLDFRQLLDG